MTDHWGDLRAEHAKALGKKIQRKLPDSGPIGVFCGIDPSGHQYISLKLGSVPAADLVGLVGIANIMAEREQDAAGIHWVTMTLLDRQYVDPFGDFALYLAKATAGSSEPAARLAELKKAVLDWRSLLERGLASGLSPHAQRGLFAELTFLKSHVLPRMPGMQALQAWQGPYRAAHDFDFGALHIEVKATSAMDANYVHINGASQLDIPPARRLMLFVLNLREVPRSGRTLPELVHEMRAILTVDATAAQAYEAALVSAGYHALHEPGYATVYSATGESFYSVQDGFPRYLPHEGTRNLSYEVDLRRAQNFVVTPTQAFRAPEAAT